VFVGGETQAALAKATEAFLAAASKHAADGTLTLPRLCGPGGDPLKAQAKRWKTYDLPVLIKGYLKTPTTHVGYHVPPRLYAFSLISDTGYLTPEEVGESENLLLQLLTEYSKRVGWWRAGKAGRVGGRHPLFKNVNCLLLIEHLLGRARPNNAARKVLTRMRDEKHAYYKYVLANTYHAGEDDEANHAWQSALWYALLTGDSTYFQNGHARDAAMRTFLTSDNLTQLAANSPYGNVTNLNARVTARVALSAAAWAYKDGRWKWLLEHYPWHESYPYFTPGPLALPMDDVKARRPDEWLGVRYLNVSKHDYRIVRGIPRDKTAFAIALRDNFEPQGQYLCMDGFSLPGEEPKSPNSILRYTDRGKTFLIGFTGKETNYYHSGLHVSRGVMNGPLQSSVRVDLAETLKDVGFLASTAPDYNGTGWTRHVLWKRGRYFLFVDRLIAREKDDFLVTVAWRTHQPMQAVADGWRQTQGDVRFFLKPAHAMPAVCGREPERLFQNETVPYMLRQRMPFAADKGDEFLAVNLLYASSPVDVQSYDPERLGKALYRIRGRSRPGGQEGELALLGLGPHLSRVAGVRTDARMFYISPRICAIAGGTFLSVGKNELIRLRAPGSRQVGTPPAMRAALRKTILSPRPMDEPPSVAAPVVRSEAIKPLWRFTDMPKGFALARAARVVTSPDGRTKTYHFARPVKIKDLALVESSAGAVEKARVTYSNDGFAKDVRMADAPPRREQRVVGPYGKSFYRFEPLLVFAGQRARSVRVEVLQSKESRRGRPPLLAAEFRVPHDVPLPVVTVKVASFDDGRPVVLAQAGDSRIVALSAKGRQLWSHRFDARLLTFRVLKWKGNRRLIAMDAAGYLNFVDAAGQRTDRVRLTSRHPKFKSEFFRSNRAYSLGSWSGSTKPGPAPEPSLVMGTYQSVAWLGENGVIDAWPANPKTIHLTFAHGYMWRGLTYFDFCLPQAQDLTGDDIVDQVFLSRGWNASPRLMFFDGATRDVYAEHKLTMGVPLTLDAVALGDGKTGIFAAAEFFAGLFAPDGKAIWKADLDLPACAATVWRANGGRLYVVGNREGMVIALDESGRLRWRTMLPARVTGMCATGRRLLVSHEKGVACFDSTGRQVKAWNTPLAHLTRLDDGRVVAVMLPGQDVIVLEP